MKRRKSNSFVLLCLTLGIVGCTKVITLDLNKSATKLVIEGVISDSPASCEVKLTKTINFDQPNSFPEVSGALVSISDNFGNTATLVEAAPGIYTLPAYIGSPGRTYTLSVTVDGKTYTAISTMNSAVAIDTLLQSSGGFDQGILISAAFSDPAGIENYYRIVAETNRKTSGAIIVQDDKTGDGLTITQELDDLEAPVPGDTVVIQLQAIDKHIYTYFNTLRELSGGGGIIGGSATLANPTSNLSDGALGYFSAFTVSSKTLVIQQ